MNNKRSLTSRLRSTPKSSGRKTNRRVGPQEPAAGISIESAVGVLRLEATADGLFKTEFAKKAGPRTFGSPAAERMLKAGVTAVRRYFAGDIRALDELTLSPAGTEFQRKVWKALKKIPAGKLVTYQDIARTIGNPGATRAVGTACGSNPICLFVPCHRVVAAGKKIGGFGGGLERKRTLLELEGSLCEVQD